MPDYYKMMFEEEICKGNRNNFLFRAFLIALAKNLPIEPLVERAKELGLTMWEINATLNSAKRIDTSNANLFAKYYQKLEKDKYINEVGRQFSHNDMLNFFRTQIMHMFKNNEHICIASLEKDKKFTYQIFTYDDLFSNDFKIPTNALVKINPLNGNGIKEIDVIDYRFLLVESDKMPITEQLDKLKESNLPIKFVIHSGNKSLHAIVRVDGETREDYYHKAKIVKDYLNSLNFVTDENVLRASTFCRLAGSYRVFSKDKIIPQYIVAENIGASNFNEFLMKRKYVKKPKLFSLSGISNIEENTEEVIIENILRKRWKMILVGDAKIGKTFMLLQLASAFSCGGYWLGRKCKQQKVLFVNAEVDDSVIIERINSMRKYYDIVEENIYLISMRGINMHFDEFFDYIDSEDTNNILQKVDIVMIDPIYKIFAGDENSQREVTRFFNCVDEKILNKGKTFIFSHHHNKGFNKGISRTSGSSVFIREPDTIVDIYRGKHNSVTVNFEARGYESISELFEFQYPIHIKLNSK